MNHIRCNHCFATIPSTTEAENERWKRWHLATVHPLLVRA